MMNYYQEQKPKEKNVNTNLVLYLGELPPEIDQYELHQFIMSQGKFNIESLIVKHTRGNKSFAYVKFKSKSEVDKAKKALHLKTLKDYVIRAEAFKKGDNKNAENSSLNLFVKNLVVDTKPKDLYELFKPFGEIISVKLKQNEKEECLGYGYVEYNNTKSANNAIETLNGFEFKGKALSVSFFTPRSQRESTSLTGEGGAPAGSLIIIKPLPEYILTEKDIESLFQPFGQINFCGIVNENVLSAVGMNIPIGVILYNIQDDVDTAMKNLNGKIGVDGHPTPLMLQLVPINPELLTKVKQAKQDSLKKKYEGCNLVVKNIPKEINDRNLFEIFKQYGDVASAKIATEGIMKEKKNQEGLVIDKEFVYESRGYGFVLFRNHEDAMNAMQNLNNQKFDYKNIPCKLTIEFYDYNKGGVHAESGNPNFKKKKFDDKGKKKNFHGGNVPYKGQMPQQMRPPQMYMQPMPSQNVQNVQHYNQPVQAKQVENVELIDEIKKIITIPAPEERKEMLGETLFYFLLSFIPKYNLNITGGKVDDAMICSKLTGILLHTDEKYLLEIVSNNEVLKSALKEVIVKLLQANKLGDN